MLHAGGAHFQGAITGGIAGFAALDKEKGLLPSFPHLPLASAPMEGASAALFPFADFPIPRLNVKAKPASDSSSSFPSCPSPYTSPSGSVVVSRRTKDIKMQWQARSARTAAREKTMAVAACSAKTASYDRAEVEPS
mmetsp:Transcript_25162/g.45620  ORF Transcript_25162/g.45620 Transcript_25162/m.45620 type:complete len:137 (-) Transcript_25162:52-462(-)